MVQLVSKAQYNVLPLIRFLASILFFIYMKLKNSSIVPVLTVNKKNVLTEYLLSSLESLQCLINYYLFNIIFYTIIMHILTNKKIKLQLSSN